MSTRAVTWFRTTIGKKQVMAISGAVWLGFVFSHMLGNLQVFSGPEKINAYAVFLREWPGVLWTARIVMALAIVVHIISAIQLKKLNSDARPSRYHRKADVATSYAARTMFWGGLALVFFILYHLAHLTWNVTGPDAAPSNYAIDVYGRVVAGFQVEWITGIYILGLLALGLHLYHGAWSFLHTLGLSHPRFNQYRKPGAMAFAILICAGFVSVPVAVLAGMLK